MDIMPITPEDEYPHEYQPDPLWWENFHFNGYDPVEKIGVTTYTAVKPFLRVREEIITVYSGNPLFFQNEEKLGENVFTSGSLKMEPLELLKKWRILMKDSFTQTEEGVLLTNKEDLEFDLYYEADTLPFGFRTERENRYEQPGSLKGEIHINSTTVNFEGKGMRDHSWGIRHIPSWGDWYVLMGYLNPGFVSCALMTVGGETFCQGWIKRDTYYDIQNMRINPVFSNNVLEKCHIKVETAEETLKINSYLISFVNITMGEEQEKSKVKETLVEIDGGGHGFLWYSR